jgi:hypothetical protein
MGDFEAFRLERIDNGFRNGRFVFYDQNGNLAHLKAGRMRNAPGRTFKG